MVQREGGGKCQCQEGGIHIKNTSELQKCSHCSSQAANCKHSTDTSKDKGKKREERILLKEPVVGEVMLDKQSLCYSTQTEPVCPQINL